MENNKYYRKDPLDIREYFNNDKDYTTNSPSYYDALARFTTTLRILTERLNDVEGRVIDLFLEWLRDGVIEEIINVNIFTDLNNRLNAIRDDFDNHIENEFNVLLNDFNTLLDDFERFVTETNDDIGTLNQDLATLRNDMNDLINDINNSINDINREIDKINDRVPKNHYVSSAFSNLQQAVYGAEGGTLYVKPDTYLITTPIKIRSNTKIIAYGSTFKRNANIDNMFINDSNGTKGGFGANRNIEFHGGTIDGAGGSFVDDCTMIAFGHCSNIRIIDVTFKNLSNWHMVELNAVDNCVVDNCIFKDYGTQTKGTEMLQIDIAKGTSQFPWFGPYDNTTCNEITIKNCAFIDGVRGVGTHSYNTGTEHTKISIINNEFRNMRSEAIYGLDWAFLKVNSNHFYNVKKGVHLRALSRNVFNFTISDNYLSGVNNDGDSRGIQITGVKEGFNLQEGSIINNKIKRFGGHSIGIDFSRSWIVIGNDISSSGKSGIIIYGSELCNVSNNSCRLSNSLGGTDVDIITTTGSIKTLISNNNVNTIRANSSTSEVLITGNIVNSNIERSGSGTHSLSNLVNNSIV